jgi:hypothetical protein
VSNDNQNIGLGIKIEEPSDGLHGGLWIVVP